MRLNELSACFKRLPVIVYASDHCSAIVVKKDLQHIVGTAYKGRNKTNQYGQVSCQIYAFFTTLNIGILVGDITHPDCMHTEEIEKMFINNQWDTLERFVEKLERVVSEGDFIRNVEIELIRVAAPEKVEAFSAAKAEYVERQDAEDAEREAKEALQEAANRREKSEMVEREICAAVDIIRTGGYVLNSDITMFREGNDGRSYKLINILARRYGVKIPLKVQGWINKSLYSVTIENGRVVSYQCEKHTSETFCQYMDQLIEAIQRHSYSDYAKQQKAALESSFTQMEACV